MNYAGVITFFFLIIGIGSATLVEDPNWIANVNGAPLAIVAKGRTITVRNDTKQLVRSFRLGCVHARRRHPAVVHLFPLESTAIPPLGKTIRATFDGAPGEQVTCQNLSAQLAV